MLYIFNYFVVIVKLPYINFLQSSLCMEQTNDLGVN